METLLLSLCAVMPVALPMSNTQAQRVCQYEKHILDAAKKNKIDPYLLASVIYVESAFRPRVMSHAGACGLTQVIPKWTGGKETSYRKYTCEQLKNPRTAIYAGARILSYVTRVYAKGDIDKGLCYYNAGGRCLRMGKLYKKTRYVKKIKEVWNAITDGC